MITWIQHHSNQGVGRVDLVLHLEGLSLTVPDKVPEKAQGGTYRCENNIVPDGWPALRAGQRVLDEVPEPPHP